MAWAAKRPRRRSSVSVCRRQLLADIGASEQPRRRGPNAVKEATAGPAQPNGERRPGLEIIDGEPCLEPRRNQRDGKAEQQQPHAEASMRRLDERRLVAGEIADPRWICGA